MKEIEKNQIILMANREKVLYQNNNILDNKILSNKFSEILTCLNDLPTPSILLINYFEKNYLISKHSIWINLDIHHVYCFNPYSVSGSFNTGIKNNHFDYKDLNQSQKLVVFSCLMGYRTNKEIAIYLSKYNITDIPHQNLSA